MNLFFEYHPMIDLKIAYHGDGLEIELKGVIGVTYHGSYYIRITKELSRVISKQYVISPNNSITSMYLLYNGDHFGPEMYYHIVGIVFTTMHNGYNFDIWIKEARALLNMEEFMIVREYYKELVDIHKTMYRIDVPDISVICP
jgi:hypothetical protein